MAPADYQVRLDTSKGPIVIQVHRAWAQFGINGDAQVAARWRGRTIPDDPRGQSVTRERVAFAFALPNGRTSQVYISLRDNSYQDDQGFVPFGEVVEGMDVAAALNSEYGENSGGGIRAGKQQPLFDGGNAYLDREFPRLDRILRARVIQ
jgi:cyclophilin family peptidyl-prolyl cis-trans isomerase